MAGTHKVESGSPSSWRRQMAEAIAARLDPERFGVKALYLIGSSKRGTASAASDIDLLVHTKGTERQLTDLLLWLEGWSLCLDEMNSLGTGERGTGLLDIHIVTDEDIARHSSFAIKIGALTDPAYRLPLKTK